MRSTHRDRRFSCLAFSLALLALSLGAATGAAAEEKIYSVGGDVSKPVRVSSVAPKYSAEAKEARHEGVVVLQTVIDKSGDVEVVKVVQEQPLGLTQEAIDAVEQWKFEPAELDGAPVKVKYTLTINFRLDKGQG